MEANNEQFKEDLIAERIQRERRPQEVQRITNFSRFAFQRKLIMQTPRHCFVLGV